jgi:uncharacterized membrane protein YphA (DoxX/SURF4 family)
MRKLLSNKLIILFLRLAIGFVFIYAGTQKISNPESFAISISNYKLLPIWIINFLAISLPWLELISGLLLMLGILTKESTLIIFTMLIVFTIVVIISLARGLNIECGCFDNGTKIGLFKLSENLLMILGCAILIFNKSDFSASN